MVVIFFKHSVYSSGSPINTFVSLGCTTGHRVTQKCRWGLVYIP